MRNRLSVIVCGALLLAGSGCLSSRRLGGMSASGDKNVTLLQTQDVYSVAYLWPVKAVHQFWKCSEAPGEITCQKSCSADGTDLICPAGGMTMANIK